MPPAPTNKSGPKSYSVGQVLYLFSTTDKTIIPVQVVIKDKQIIEKLGSMGPVEQITYRVVVPNDKNKLYVLSELKGEIYLSLNDLQAFMEKRMKEQITKLILTTKEKAKNSFGKSAEITFQEEHEEAPELLVESEMEEFLEVAIDATEQRTTPQMKKHKYQDMVSDESEDEDNSGEGMMLTLPDGQVIRGRNISIGSVNDSGR